MSEWKKNGQRMEEKDLGGEEQVVLKGKEQMKGYGRKQWQPEGMRKWKRQEAVHERGVDKAFW